MEKNPWDALDGLGGAGDGAETPSPDKEAEAAPKQPPAAPSPVDDATRQRAEKTAASFRAHKEKKRRQADGKGVEANPPAATAPREPQNQNRRAAEARPADNLQVDPEDAARERRRKRTNWNLRESAMTKPDPDEPGVDNPIPPKRRERFPDEPMRFEIDRSQPGSREIPSVIPNEELQKAGWSAERFAGHEKKTEKAMAARGENLEQKLRGKILAELDAIAKDAAAETENPVEPTARQAEEFARMVSRAAGESPAPEREPDRKPKKHTVLSVREMKSVEAALNAEDYDALMRAFGRMAKVAGEDAAEAETTMRQNFSEADVPKLKEQLLQQLKGVTVEIPAEYADRKQPAAKPSRPAAAAEPSPLAPDDAARVDAFIANAEAMTREREQQLRDAHNALPKKKKAKKKPLPENRDRDGNPIEVDVIDNPDAVLSPSQKQALREKMASKGVARKGAATVDEAGNVIADAAPEFARERHEVDMTEDEAKEFKVHRAAEGNEDAESVRRYREKVAEEVQQSKVGRRRLRTTIENEAFRRSIRLKKGDKILSPNEIYVEGDRVIREQGAMERELEASLPPEGDDGARARAAVASAVAEAATSIASGSDPYEKLYETLRREAPLVVGLGNEYTAETITEIVEALRRGEPGVNLADLPETFGIRQAVAQIHDQEMRAASTAAAEKAAAVDVDAEVLPPLAAAPAAANVGQQAASTPGANPAPGAGQNPGAAAGGQPQTPPQAASTGPTPPPAPGNVPPNPAAGVPPQPQAPGQPGATPRPGRASRTANAAPSQLLVNQAPGSVPPIPPTPPGPPPIPTPAATPAPAPAPAAPGAAPTPSRSWRRVLGGGLLLGGRIIGAPFAWFWKHAITEPSFPGKENPFKKERGPLYPFFWGFSWLWQTVGGMFGAKFEKKKEEKAK